MDVWNCQTGGKLNLANRDYAKDQLQLCESGEVRIKMCDKKCLDIIQPM